ncbi:MAG: group I truncated hemoglobin [Myxococcota bacterium]
MELQRQEADTLFDRLGGEQGIYALVDDIVDAHVENPKIRQRYLPLLEEPERLEEIKKHTRQFLAMGSGGPEVYEGRSMPETHRGMNIGDREYMAVVDDIMGVLEEHNIDERSQKDVLSILYSLRSEIMHK